MTVWWTKINGKVEKHAGRKPKLGAAIAISFTRASGTPLGAMHLYKQNPEKVPNAADLLPREMERAERRRGSR